MGKNIRSWRDGSSDRSFMVDPLSYSRSSQCSMTGVKKGRGMCYPVCGMMHIKRTLATIRKELPMWR